MEYPAVFTTIVKKEILEQVVSFRFIVLLLICMILIPLSLFVSNREFQNRVTDYNRLVEMSREKIENTQFMELMSEAYSVDGYVPPAPLSVFAGGNTVTIPDGFRSLRAGITFTEGSNAGNGALNLNDTIDFLFIIQVIFSLLAILFTFDAVCGERELGTLKTMLSNSIPRDIVIFGKLTGILVTMLIPFVASFVLGIVILLFSGFPSGDGDMSARIVIMAVSTVVYISVFASIGIVISSCVERSKTSVVLLLLVWIILINIIPKGAGIVAQALVPVESDSVIEIEKSMFRRNLELERGAEIAEMEKTLPQYLDITPENNERNAAINEERSRILADIRDEYERRINDEYARIDDRIRTKLDTQVLIAQFIAQLSPVTSFTNIFTTIAGTGTYDRERLITAAEAYQQTVYRELFQYIHRDISPEGHMTMSIDGDNIDLANLPVFNYTRSTLTETAGAVMIDTIIFVLFLIVTITAVYVSFLQYDVR